jgi:hypothetical protein
MCRQRYGHPASEGATERCCQHHREVATYHPVRPQTPARTQYVQPCDFGCDERHRTAQRAKKSERRPGFSSRAGWRRRSPGEPPEACGRRQRRSLKRGIKKQPNAVRMRPIRAVCLIPPSATNTDRIRESGRSFAYRFLCRRLLFVATPQHHKKIAIGLFAYRHSFICSLICSKPPVIRRVRVSADLFRQSKRECSFTC